MSADDTLTVWLKSLDPDEYAALLRARPDAVRACHARSRRRGGRALAPDGAPDGVVPQPHELAGPLLDRTSVIEAIQRLSTPQLQVFEAVQALGDGCRRDELTALMDVPDAETATLLGKVLDELAGLALIWPDGDRLRIGREAARLETRVGGALGAGLPLDALLPDLPTAALTEIALNLGLNLAATGHRDQLMASLAQALNDRDLVRSVAAEAPPRTRAVLTRLASFGLPGTPGTDDEGIDPDTVLWAAERGLVVIDLYQLAMPREVRLALRGADYRAPFQPVPPRPATTPAEARPGAAADAAMRAVEWTEALLHACAATPLGALKSGGIGVRELRRLEKATGCPVDATRLLLEVAHEAGLLDWERSAALPTERFDAWRTEPPADRLAALLGSWWRLESLPLFHPDEEGPVRCLDRRAAEPYAPLVRHAFVGAAAAIPAGQAVAGPADLVEATAWRLTLTFEEPEDADAYVATLWEEAATLGVIADGRPSPLATGLTDGDPAGSVGALFADEVTDVLFQNDLTAVATGPASLAMIELLDVAADREARGSASIWRFSPDSVRRALDRGLPAPDLTRALSALSRSGTLPNVLTRLVDDVARRHGEVRVVETGCCLVVPDHALAAELVRVRSLAKLGLREIAPGVLAGALPATETVTALRRAGYMPSANAQDGTAFVDRSTRRTRRR